ncbi:DNA packaging protein [Alcelaphine gammaherpesvirus 1]|uniref:Tripartite terminase subunit 3 n=1 Tax=Alcelaphine herpesvirus 1 (strain C500) TaxID=654901 RepID=TRM3_ALHV1|nr:DNA packaging protein [Alcelaphine gammaherpesvirus 1]O36378.1 RecName: Full=Tripartite terminase subunit 3; AltName: Full=Terminase large subunit [Alcelaphine herpesvirus 1 strain C500]AAC58075.1 DNA packaging protein [Alcelaphine gammaherpesvirus 1]APB09458.1 DNA packaging terminase subunit 1 [Alcelaphine gammaherpesvirus 1]APB09530.1 DNA packaging terminase subunit 1 [Alcelaphine gammaherpesvirus 1]
MFYVKVMPALQKACEELQNQWSAKSGKWPVPETPLVAVETRRSERWPHPYLGLLPGVAAYSSTLEDYCHLYNPYIDALTRCDLGQTHRRVATQPVLSDQLCQQLKKLFSCPRNTSVKAKLEFEAAVRTHQALDNSQVFLELKTFVLNLSAFLNKRYSDRSSHIELFQKQLIMHTFFFLVSIKAPELCEKFCNIFKLYFNIDTMDQATLDIFKQKASVFLIPRRHGKTWIVVAIISILLASVQDLRIGYVAHQKHVANAVFTEVINTLHTFFPGKYMDVKKENGTIIFGLPNKKPSTLLCATCFNKNSIRGQTFQLLFVDEANFIKKDALPTILGFMLQKDAKIIFISSSNSSDQSTSFLYNLKGASERMLNVVSYVCSNHKEDFSMQDGLISCPCYSLHVPSYISIDEQIKTTTNLFLDGVFDTELMGDSSCGTLSTFQIISESALSQFELCRIDTASPQVQAHLNSTVHMYIDPAFTNNLDASGTGISVIGRLGAKTKVILGCEHFFLQKLTGTAALQIASCATSLLRSVVIIHPMIKCAQITIEGNSSQDSAVAIANFIDECAPIPVTFYHQSDKTKGVLCPLYLLGQEKAVAFESFIYAMNLGLCKASQLIVSHTIKLSFDPVTYLLEQVRAIKCQSLRDGSHTYHAKQKNLSDDLLVSVVMSLYLSSANTLPFKPLHIERFF